MNVLNRVKNKALTLLLPRLKPTGYQAFRSLPDDLKKLVNRADPVIIDGGANVGEITDGFLVQYKQPTIYCVEPHQESAQFLKKKFFGKPNIHIITKALGDHNGVAQFNVSNNLPSSSLLGRTDLNRDYHGDITATQSVVSVDVVRLDSLFENFGMIDLLKLDIEGYELEAIKGSENILPNIRIIMAEVWFVGSYKDAPYFSDIESHLRTRGFSLLNLYNSYTHPNMQLTTADAVFINRKFFPNHHQFN